MPQDNDVATSLTTVGLPVAAAPSSRGTLNLQGRVMWRMNEYQTVLFITLVAVLVALALVN